MRQELSLLVREIRALRVDESDLRSFGRVVGGVLIGIALLVAWWNGWTWTTTVLVLGGSGGALLVLGLAWPGALRPVYHVWMAVALALGFVMTRVLLTVVYYLMVTPIGLLRRVVGTPAFEDRPDPDADSYWQQREEHDDASERLEKYW
jgi:hypothetical protein